MKLNGKIAIITGSTGTIGAAVAKMLAEKGCHCVCQYHKNKQKAKQLQKKMADYNAVVEIVQADLTIPQEIKKLFLAAKKIANKMKSKPAQILVNSAAVFQKQPLSKVTAKSIEKIYNLNLKAPIFITKMFAEKIKAQKAKQGKIINLTDVAADRPWANYSIYCSSKAALIAASKALAKELAPVITINCVSPGVVTWGRKLTEKQKKQMIKKILAKRTATPQEIADAVKFLIENDYVTGQVIKVDGGSTI